jgi:hypothetical protein
MKMGLANKDIRIISITINENSTTAPFKATPNALL